MNQKKPNLNTIKNLNYSTPIIFNKKLNKTNIKKLEFIYGDTGKAKHFPPAAQEWYNSIYTYNTNYIKNLPVLDNTLMNLLKSYFNMFINHKVLNTEFVDMIYRRRSSKRIFIGRGDLKHTNSKVIITFYVYNTEKMSLKREFLNLFDVLNLSRRKNIKNNNPLSEKEITYNFYITEFFIKNLNTYLVVLNKYFKYLTSLVKLKVLNNNEKFIIFTNKTNSFYAYNYPSYYDFKSTVEKRYLENLYKLQYLLKFNNVKFEKPFILNLTRIVEELYNKKVEFNIVNLKKVYLNSDIFTQAIVLKLKNKYRLWNVFKSSLAMINLPNVSRLGEKFHKSNKNEFLINKIRNNYINNMFKNDITNIDPLNKLLLDFFPSTNNLEIETNSSEDKDTISLRNYVFSHLKHSKLGGIRLEAKGRLSRRYTASRSVFKLDWKGGLKNVDSSFKGLSTVMLRGNIKSNVEYSLLVSKKRIGAYGIKGWVSSK
jgi:Mitochondrial ribosomal protein (VAR1)